MSYRKIAVLAQAFLGVFFALAIPPVHAQPPALIHYQGRLTDNLNNPITVSTVVYFSLYRGGSATTANSGTLLYREHATILPDANGVFDHRIGSGTVDSGTLDPQAFNTAQPMFLQLSVTTVGTVVLPRTQMTSVGYAFGAAFAGKAQTAQQSGSPLVTSITDATGGVVVVGDLLQIQGSGLTNAAVTVGGKLAPIKSKSASQLVCQVPAGVPMGLNPVAIIEGPSGINSVTIAHVDVHRLLVYISPGSNPQVAIIDANTRTVLSQINLPFTIITETTIPRIQPAFGNQGSLLLIPSNSNVIWGVDLTANPPALINFNANVTASRANAISISPDGVAAVISDLSGNKLLLQQLNQFFPPYTSSLFGGAGNFPSVYPSGFSAPRGSTFIGNSLLLVCATGSNQLYAFRRVPGTLIFNFYEPLDTGNINIRTSLGSNQPFAIRPTDDLTRILVINRSADNLNSYYVAPEGFGDPATGQSESGGAFVYNFSATNDGKIAVAANSESTNNLKDDLHLLNIDAGKVQIVGDFEGPGGVGVTARFHYAAIEPVEGRVVAVSRIDTNNNSTVQFFQRDGGTVFPLAVNGLVTVTNQINRPTYSLEFQP